MIFAMVNWLFVVVFCFTIVGCKSQHPHSTSDHPFDVAPLPQGFAGSPVLTPAQVESIRVVLLDQEFTEMEALQAALPDGLIFMPRSHALMSSIGEDGQAHPYTEVVSVCRLGEDQDLLVVSDNRSGWDVIQQCFIRDLNDRNR